VSAYEELRRVATGRPSRAGHGVGFALFLRRGMAAWIEASGAVAPPLPPPPRLSQAERDRLLPTDVRGEVTMVLVAMALSVAVQGGLTT